MSLLKGESDPHFKAMFNDAVSSYRKRGQLSLGIQYLHLITEALEGLGIESSSIDSYCLEEFGDTNSFPLCMMEVLTYVFRLDIGVSWAPGEVYRLCPGLEFDKDELLVGPENFLNYTKDGVFYQDKQVIRYHDYFYKYNLGLSGGFIDWFIRYVKHAAPLNFGLRINGDLVIDAASHSTYLTKAFIRGPKGLTKDMLQDPEFPEDPSGTVTVHQRIDEDSLASKLFPLIRTEVMWSIRDGIKTIQIEELVQAKNSLSGIESEVYNRYLHSRWDPISQCFVHLDGAVKVYSGSEYESRCKTDIKKTEKADGYFKLFRVDGEITLEIWEELTVRFFYQNELVLEYLGGPSMA